MAKSAFYNKERAKQEMVEKEVKATEAEKRTAYFLRLKNDKNFQKYVIEDVIRKGIDGVTDATLLKNLAVTVKTKDEFGELMLRRLEVREELLKIFNNLM